MWHTLTNHPAHQQDQADRPGGADKDGGKKQDKPGDEPKKPNSASS